MGKKYRSVPVGVIAGSLALVYDWWDWEFTIVNVILSIVSFIVITAVIARITEAIISSVEKEESIKPVIGVSFGIAVFIFVFAFLVKTKM
ncbi:hypothetical protein [Flavonifractor sp. An4]|uniref:hypothetical protein n=1 Tax=Flavonifractor sp. An4 TaxID=1965634 RepID=UPI00117B3B75|nr:hypothetical protein [Flavonifractor sp. An4]